MPYIIVAHRNGERIETARITLGISVAKAQMLRNEGWQVYIFDLTETAFPPISFEQLPALNHEPFSE